MQSISKKGINWRNGEKIKRDGGGNEEEKQWLMRKPCKLQMSAYIDLNNLWSHRWNQCFCGGYGGVCGYGGVDAQRQDGIEDEEEEEEEDN